MDLTRLHGIFPPVLTPLHEDQRIDHESLASLVDHLIGEGVHGIWAMGTTGEFACFDADERESAIRTTVQAVRGRVPIIANVGDASTHLTLEHARRAARLGVDAIAATPPYYYPNNQDELDGYYREIHAAVELPLLLYHIPQTVKVKVDPPFVRKLARDGVIVGLKDSQNDLEWYRRVLFNAQADGVDLRCFLGTTGLIDLVVYAGGAGAIPGISNVTAAEGRVADGLELRRDEGVPDGAGDHQDGDLPGAVPGTDGRGVAPGGGDHLAGDGCDGLAFRCQNETTGRAIRVGWPGPSAFGDVVPSQTDPDSGGLRRWLAHDVPGIRQVLSVLRNIQRLVYRFSRREPPARSGASLVAVQYLPPSSQAPERIDGAWVQSERTIDHTVESDAPRSSDLAERLARWAIVYLTALAAMLSLVGGAWALGVLGR